MREHPSIFDFFTIGIGPSSSHSIGPMRAAGRFVRELERDGAAARVAAIRTELFGSLALTGSGHGTGRAVLLGLEGEAPESVDPAAMASRVEAIRERGRLRLPGGAEVAFREPEHLVAHRDRRLPFHPNALRFTALAGGGEDLFARVYYSVGGGFVLEESEARAGARRSGRPPPPAPFETAADLLRIAREGGARISDVALENERAWRSEAEVRRGLLGIRDAMESCVERGCHAEGVLPGGLGIPRRAPALWRELTARPEAALRDPLSVLDWVDLYALAVNEENAAGGRVVTAPTNGAAGILPAVLHYWERFCAGERDRDEGAVRFLLVAGAIAILYQKNASISGAEVGCQGEVGVACSMAAGALAEVMGGSIAQVEQAAEIGMEHNLGLTCDPIGGLVQVPCIERNAMGAVKAINAARLASRGRGGHYVSLDRVIAVMRRTGADMSTKYKETSRGGLAVNVSEC